MKLLNRIAKDKLSIIVSLIAIALTSLSVKSFYPSNDTSATINNEFKLFPFVINDLGSDIIKTAFFAEDPYNEFLKLKTNANVLFASSASFTSSINSAKNFPVGFCSENGNIINKMPNQTMDGLVMITNDHDDIDNIKVIDLDYNYGSCYETECVTHITHTNIRNNPAETYAFLNTIEENKLSSFQTQLVYTKYKSDEENYKNLFNGNNDRTRRFLAICEKDDILHHVIVDATKEDYLMATAKDAVEFLRASNYSVDFMINLDTGSKDIIHAYNGEFLENLRPNPLTASATIENASSLLVYYTEL